MTGGESKQDILFQVLGKDAGPFPIARWTETAPLARKLPVLSDCTTGNMPGHNRELKYRSLSSGPKLAGLLCNAVPVPASSHLS